MAKELTVEELSTFAKKKGFVYPSSEIYGGLTGIYDYGHIGTLLKRAFENEWRKYFLRLDENFVEIDTGLIMHENVFKASGHLENFFDPIVTIQGSEETFRADHLVEEHTGKRAEELSNEEMLKIIVEKKLLGEDIDYKKVAIENLNMMFPVEMGPKKGIKAYLRPETAQSPYVNFRAQYELQRKKLPLGLALIGRVYRNEIAPRNMLLRTREVEQAELQIFFNPNRINEHEKFDSIKDYKLLVMKKEERKKIQEISAQELVKKGIPKFYVYHMVIVQKFYLEILQIPKEQFRFYELNDEEKAFYNKYHFDIEVKLHSVGDWVELGGVHYRTDHDLKGHEKVSKVKMEVLDEETREKFIPHVLELSFGVGRNIYGLLDAAYTADKERGNDVVKLPIRFAPYKVAVLPLVKKGGLQEKAREIYEDLLEENISAFFDISGTVGKRYAREDEKGTAFCVTVDFETIEDPKLKDTVTLRDRDSTEQKRIAINKLAQTLRDLTSGKTTFAKL